MKIENLKKVISVNNINYFPNIYLNAWGNWTIAYKSLNKHYLCSVVIEPENKPVDIMDVPANSLNAGIGNARTFDDAIDMIINYIDKTYGKR